MRVYGLLYMLKPATASHSVMVYFPSGYVLKLVLSIPQLIFALDKFNQIFTIISYVMDTSDL